jgi:choline dehydrogenase-like flavoprotein
MNINSNGILANTYDAIVVGSGISGGWAAKELAEKGLKVLVLERGKDVKHVTDYPTMTKHPWELPNMDKVSVKTAEEYQVQKRTGYTVSEAYRHFFVNDKEHPFVEKQPFGWMRGYHVGGKSITWGKQSYRLSPMDFEANEKEGIATPWPVKYDEIAPWYSKVEKFIGVSGAMDGLPQLPDGEFQPAMDMNCVEKATKKSVEAKWASRKIVIGRAAHLTAPTEEQTSLGRASCQYRNMCMRGCPFGAYFSSQAATLPAAARTGNMTLRPNSIVHSVIYNDDKGKADGVRVVDQATGKLTEFFAKIIFLNAGAVPSTSILMNTESKRYQNGMDESDSLGRYLMDHHLAVGASGVYDGFEDRYYHGRRPNGLYFPRYRNIEEPGSNGYLRGFGYQGAASRQGWGRGMQTEGFGAAFKDKMSEPGPWSLGIQGFGECLPYYDNRISLDKTKIDKWGLPTLVADASFKENEMKMRVDMQQDAIEMLEAAGFKNVKGYDSGANIGLGIHEMGTARMGSSAKNSVLNKYNQVWGALNVFCTDGAFMTSAGCQNPSLTYMAFTARAADYAVSELKKGNL